MRYSLSQEKWKLMGTDSYVPLRDRSMETGQVLRGVTPWMDCTIPSGAALTLYRTGWIEYPYFEMNSLKCEWIENRWWIYRTEFDRPALSGTKYRLFFRGVDYDCLVYLNGQFLGEHIGMYESFSFDITDQFRSEEKFVLQIVLKHAPDEMGQIGYTSMTRTQKSRFNYKWDFGTRLVNLGVWQDIEIIAENDHALGDVSLTSDVSDSGDGLISFSGSVTDNVSGNLPLTVTAEVRFQDRFVAAVSVPVEDGAYSGEILLENPLLWYPNGHGEQPLYDVTLRLASDNGVYDEKSFRQGIRRLRYLPNDNAPEGALPYVYEVNGRRIYIKGVNITPLDHIYGDIPRKRYEATLRAIANMNVNMIRVWGGGIIEKECFYNLCDELGLMVWQEFIQSSSGIDNIPSKHADFLALLEKTARCALKEKRNHTCLSAWSGGNELMDKDNVPSTYEDENIAMLRALANELDPARFMYPTSASGPTEWQKAQPGMSHDVHGDWKYRGNPHHYESYAAADNLFHSEFGCEGASGMRNMNRVLSPEHRKPVSMDIDDVWRFHGDWWCTYDRDTGMFGAMEHLPEYIFASQWVQAEAIRYILEANRRKAFRNSGSIIWQFNEPWPNVSCTCLYTYFDEPKMAYYWTKRAFGNYHVSLDYSSLNPPKGSIFRGDIWLSAEKLPEDRPTLIRAEVLTPSGRVLHAEEFTCTLSGGHSSRCTSLSFPVPDEPVYIVRVSASTGSLKDENCYFFSTEAEEIYRPFRQLPAANLEVTRTAQNENRMTYLVKNTGSTAALHVHAVEDADRWLILPDDGYFTLFPGESREISIGIQPRFNYGFDEYKEIAADCEPQIRFVQFADVQ